MRCVLITQRVSVDEKHGERRDCLDQRWASFLHRCDLAAIPVPNLNPSLKFFTSLKSLAGIILSGGNDLGAYGGDAPERDETEKDLLRWAQLNGVPVLGVCRGMQVIQDFHGVRLEKLGGHVTPKMMIHLGEERLEVNSYHRWGTRETVPDLEVGARAEDGVIKMVKHRKHPWTGIMWHPERYELPRPVDIEMVRSIFKLSDTK